LADARQSTRWWRAPLWLLELATGYKSFADNPILGSPRLNRAGLHANRVKLAHRLAWARRRRLAAAVPRDWREQFDRDGFVMVRDFLDPDQFARLREALLNSEFDTRAHQQGDTVTRRVAVGPPLLKRIPELRALLARRDWKALLSYIGSTRSEPLYYVQTIAAGVAEGPPDPQLQLHSDTFHPSLKAWLFLTDVGEDDRPLTYVPGSHRLTPERLAWEQARSVAIAGADRLTQRGSFRVDPQELSALNLPQPIHFAVPANTLVAVDTCGFHARADSNRPTLRVELWAYSRRSPFLPWTGLDPLSLPGLAERRAGWAAAILDRLDRRGWAQQHWRAVGKRRPMDGA
jgi:hypothetical protein